MELDFTVLSLIANNLIIFLHDNDEGLEPSQCIDCCVDALFDEVEQEYFFDDEESYLDDPDYAKNYYKLKNIVYHCWLDRCFSEDDTLAIYQIVYSRRVDLKNNLSATDR